MTSGLTQSIPGAAESLFLADYDLHSLTEGARFRNHEKIGAPIVEREGRLRGRVWWITWSKRTAANPGGRLPVRSTRS